MPLYLLLLVIISVLSEKRIPNYFGRACHTDYNQRCWILRIPAVPTLGTGHIMFVVYGLFSASMGTPDIAHL